MSSEDGYDVYKRIRALPPNASYSTIIPENIPQRDLEFVARTLREIRRMVCVGKYKPGAKYTNTSLTALVSGLATSLTASLGVSSTLATGLAAAVLVVVAQAAHKSFCEMTDDQIIEAVEKRAATTRKKGTAGQNS